MELRHLKYFVAVVEAGTMRRASYQLYVAQPSISRALVQLEASLGVTLMNRLPHGIEMTDEGREFFMYAKRILAQADEAQTAMRRRAKARNSLRIGVVAGIHGTSWLTAPIFETFREQHPDTHVELVEISFEDQTEALVGCAVDVAIVRPPVHHREVDIVTLAHEPRALLVSAEHDFAGEPDLSVEDILRHPTAPLAGPEDWAAYWQLDELRGGNIAPSWAQPADSVHNIQLSAVTGEMVLTVPISFNELAPHPLLKTVPLRDVDPCQIAIARRNGDRRRDVGQFIERAVTSSAAATLQLDGWSPPEED